MANIRTMYYSSQHCLLEVLAKCEVIDPKEKDTTEYERHDLGHGVFFHQIFELIYLF